MWVINKYDMNTIHKQVQVYFSTRGTIHKLHTSWYFEFK